MRALIIGSVLLASTAVAHARKTMTFDLVGGNADGTSVLFTRHLQVDDRMGSVFGYVIITAGDAKPFEVTTMDNLADKPNVDAPADKVDAAACNRVADTLGKALAAKKFKTMKIEKNECKGSMRTVVHTASILPGQKVPEWWVVGTGGSNAHNPPTKREAAALAAAATVSQGNPLIAASPDDGKLVVVFYGGAENLVFAYFNKGTLVAKDL